MSAMNCAERGPNFTSWQMFALTAAEWQHLRVSALDSWALMEPGAAWQEGNGMAFGLYLLFITPNFSAVPEEGFGAGV